MDNDYLIGFVLVAGLVLVGYGWNQGWFQSILSQVNGSSSPGETSGNRGISPVSNPRGPVMVVDPVQGIRSPVTGQVSGGGRGNLEPVKNEVQKKSASQVMSHFLRDLPYDPAYDWNDDGKINSTDSSLAFKAL